MLQGEWKSFEEAYPDAFKNFLPPSCVTSFPPTQPPSLAVLTHGLQLANQLFLAPFCPLLLVGVDGAEDGTARLPTVFDGGDVQVVHQHDIWILERAETQRLSPHPLPIKRKALGGGGQWRQSPTV